MYKFSCPSVDQILMWFLDRQISVVVLGLSFAEGNASLKCCLYGGEDEIVQFASQSSRDGISFLLKNGLEYHKNLYYPPGSYALGSSYSLPLSIMPSNILDIKLAKLEHLYYSKQIKLDAEIYLRNCDFQLCDKIEQPQKVELEVKDLYKKPFCKEDGLYLDFD